MTDGPAGNGLLILPGLAFLAAAGGIAMVSAACKGATKCRGESKRGGNSVI